MWTPTTRAQHSRADLRYGSDVTDAEWLILSPFLLATCPCGQHRKRETRETVNAIFYVLRGGIAWSLLPKDFQPWPIAIAGSPGYATTARGRRSTITWSWLRPNSDAGGEVGGSEPSSCLERSEARATCFRDGSAGTPFGDSEGAVPVAATGARQDCAGRAGDDAGPDAPC